MNQPQTPPTRSKQAIDPENTPPNGYSTPIRSPIAEKMMAAGYLSTGNSPQRKTFTGTTHSPAALKLNRPIPTSFNPRSASPADAPQVNSPSRPTPNQAPAAGLDTSIINRQAEEKKSIEAHTLTQTAGPLMRLLAGGRNIDYDAKFLDKANILLGYQWRFNGKLYLIIEKQQQKDFLEKLAQQQLTDHSLNNVKLYDPDLSIVSVVDGSSEEQDQAKDNSHYTTLYDCPYTGVIYAPEIAHEDCYDDLHKQFNRILAEIKLEIHGPSRDAAEFIYRSLDKTNQDWDTSMLEGIEASTDIPASPPLDNHTPEYNLRQNTRTARSLAFGGNTTDNDDERPLSLADRSFEEGPATLNSTSTSSSIRQGAGSPSSMLSIALDDSLTQNDLARSPMSLTNQFLSRLGTKTPSFSDLLERGSMLPTKQPSKTYDYCSLEAPGATTPARPNTIILALLVIASPFIQLWTWAANFFSFSSTKQNIKSPSTPTLFATSPPSEIEQPNIKETGGWEKKDKATFLLEHASDDYYASKLGKEFTAVLLYSGDQTKLDEKDVATIKKELKTIAQPSSSP